jgi:hypothetical protein
MTLTMLVATRSFRDPTDGQMIVAGRTHVHPRADVARMFPASFRPIRGRTPALARSAGAGRSGRDDRPAWQLETQSTSWRL